MRDMKSDGKLDVIEMRRANTEIVGAERGGTKPHDMERDGGTYLLCNGGFFIMGGATGMRYDVDGRPLDAKKYDHYSVGRTSSTTNQIPIPPSQRAHYEMLEGSNGRNYLYSGPKLIKRLDLSSPELQYKDAYVHHDPI